MRSNYRITIKRKSQPGWLMWFIILFPFTFGTLIDFLNVPTAIKYILDLAWLSLVVYMVIFHRNLPQTKTKGLLIWIVAFFTYTLLVYMVRYQSVFYYLWGFRNNFRFYIVFFAFPVFMDETEAEGYLSLFDKLFWVQLILCLAQYFLLGYKGDFLGGLFGVETGSNAYLNVYYIIITAKSVLYCLNHKESVSHCLLKCGVALLVAALAELKFFFIEFIIIVLLCMLITSFSWRKLWILVASIVGVLAAITLLVSIYPFFRRVFSVEGFLELVTNDQGYTFRGDLNRLTAIPEINRRFFTGIWDQIFGLGMGNCDVSAYDFLLTPFAQKHLWTHYSWFSIAFVYLEMGWIGLIFFFGFFVLHYVVTAKLEKTGKCNVLHCKLARIVAISCILVGVYNSSLRTEVGYMAYFVLALPFMQRKGEPGGE